MKKATCTLQKLYPVSKCDDGDNVFHSVLLSKTLTPLTPFVTPSVQFLSKEKPFCRRVCGCSEVNHGDRDAGSFSVPAGVLLIISIHFSAENLVRHSRAGMNAA